MYNTWGQIKQRCNNPNNPQYMYYGGRGIAMCQRWASNFEDFYTDVGARPEGMTLDRIDNNKGYEITNVRWATKQEQARNRRCVVAVAHDGKQMFLHEWAEVIGVSHDILKKRWQLGERPPELLEPRRGRKHDAPIEFIGVMKSPRDWAEYLGVAYTTILYRAKYGLPLDKQINRKKV
jgi:hypothetical protein